MQISEERIDQYIALYLEEYGKPIERVQARNELTALICLLEAVYKHLNKTPDGR